MENNLINMANPFAEVLKFRDFKRIWLSQVFSQIALNMLTFALILHIYEITGKATSISLVMLASAIPVALLGPFSGTIADKINGRKILLYTNILRFIAAIILLLSPSNVLAMLEIIFLISALSQIFSPAESSAIPDVVEKEQLVSANSLVMTTTYATLLIGYGAAGPLLNYVGPSWLFVICAALFIFATWSTSLLSDYNKRSGRINIINLASSIERAWRDMKEGLLYSHKTKNILQPMTRLTVGWGILGAAITLLPVYGSEVLKLNPKFIGPIALIPISLGMILAVAYLHKREKPITQYLMNLGFFVVGASLMLFSLYYFYQSFFLSFAVLMVSIIFIGFGCSLIQIPGQTLLHLNSKEDKRGRVFGISTMQLRLAQALPALLMGGLSDLTSPLVTMILLAVFTLVYSLILMFE